jgi:hypothetical protein
MSEPVMIQLSNEAVSCGMPSGACQVCPASLCLPAAVPRAHWTMIADDNGTLAKLRLERSVR